MLDVLGTHVFALTFHIWAFGFEDWLPVCMGAREPAPLFKFPNGVSLRVGLGLALVSPVIALFTFGAFLSGTFPLLLSALFLKTSLFAAFTAFLRSQSGGEQYCPTRRRPHFGRLSSFPQRLGAGLLKVPAPSGGADWHFLGPLCRQKCLCSLSSLCKGHTGFIGSLPNRSKGARWGLRIWSPGRA